MATYGKTWWGNKWLEIFNDITFSSRLPRGRTYATKGAVGDIALDEGKASSTVQGSRPSPYRVKISFQSLTTKDQKKIIDHINQSPTKLMQLINRELPTSLYDFLENNQIKIFPSSWADAEALCSCPDTAVPCKHIAALIYVITKLIDQDPFTLFKLFGLDLLKALDCEKYKAKVQAIMKIEVLIATHPTLKEVKPYPQDANFFSLALKEIPHLLPLYEEILEAHPRFYEKEFKRRLKEIYTYWKQYAKKKFKATPKELPDAWRDAKAFTSLSLVINNKNQCVNIYTQDEAHKKCVKSLVTFLEQIPVAEINQYCQSIQTLYFLHKYVLLSLEKSALAPEIWQNEQQHTLIRWIPATFHKEVRFNIKQFTQYCPNDLVQLQTQDTRHPIRSDQVVKTAFSILVNYHLPVHNASPMIQSYLQECDIMEMFFANQAVRFTSLARQNIPSLIYLWLNKLHLASYMKSIYLFIEEAQDHFLLHLKVATTNTYENLFDHLAHLAQVDKAAQLKLLSKISVLFEYIPTLEKLIEDKNARVAFHHTRFDEIFFKKIPALQSLGIQIVLPKSLKKIHLPKIQAKVTQTTDSSLSLLSLEELLHFDWKIAIGDKQYTLDEFKKLSQTTSALVRIHGEYVVLKANEVKNMIKQMQGLAKTTLRREEILQACLGKQVDGIEAVIGENIQQFFKRLLRVKPVPVPANLQATLRPYQKRGMQWLIQNMRVGFGSILADDMGLGKTIQVIAMLLHYKNLSNENQQKTLIIAPTGLISNWQKEINKFAPSLKVKVYHGLKRRLDDFAHDVLLTSYGTARNDQQVLNATQWFLCVIDEAQQIKNPDAKLSKAIKSIITAHKIALTGTPVENRLLEYWSIFDFVNKGYLGTQSSFIKKFSIPIEKECNPKRLALFHEVTKPFIMRRLKADKKIIKDLPDKVENNIYCALTAEQTALYNEIVNLEMERISKGDNRAGAIFNLLIALKQVCNHPAQYTKREQATITQSGKLETLHTLLDSILKNGEKVIIFTQFIKTGEIMARNFEAAFHTKIAFLHGGIHRKVRDKMITDFQHSPQVKIIIISLKAGGTGLNLVAANHVIHYDLWWNPAVEFQATDRAYRIGQRKNVFVYRFITSGTLEEKIDKIISHKKRLSDMTVTSGEKWITQLSDEEIRNLVAL